MFSFFRKRKKNVSPVSDPALLAEMKALWFRYGGSSVAMTRDDLRGSHRFAKAHIPDETVEEWRQEMIESELTALIEGDPTRRWIVAGHLLELIGNTDTRTEEQAARLLDTLYDLADTLDKPQRILILEHFAGRNASRDNGGIYIIHKGTSLTPRMSDVLRKLADFTVSVADNQPDIMGWTDVPRRYEAALSGIREAYKRFVTTP